MSERIAILVTAAILSGLLEFWNIVKKPLQPTLNPLYILSIFFTLSVMSLIPSLHNIIQPFWTVLVFLHIGIYYTVLLWIMPFLRRRYRPQLTATLWLIPNILVILRNTASPVLMPLVMIALPDGFLGAFSIIWLCGFLFVMGMRVFQHLRLRREILNHSRPADQPEMLEIFSKAKEETGFTRDIPLLISPYTKTPFSIGLFQSSVFIVLPEISYTEDEQKLIFRHELIHILRQDTQTKFFLSFITAFCWFIPMIYSAMKRCSEDLELAVDELTVKDLTQPERNLYAQLILKTGADERGFTSCLSADAKALRYRLAGILSSSGKRNGLILLIVFTMTILLSFGTISFSWNASSLKKTAFETFGDQPVMRTIYRENWVNTMSGETLTCKDPQGLKEYLGSFMIAEAYIDRDIMKDPSVLIIHFGEERCEYTIGVYSHMIGIGKYDTSGYDTLFWLDQETDWQRLLSYFEYAS